MERYRSIVLHGVSLEICDRMNILKYSLLVTWILDFCMIMLVILDEDSGSAVNGYNGFQMRNCVAGIY